MSQTAQCILDWVNEYYTCVELCSCGEKNHANKFVVEIPLVSRVCNFDVITSISIEKIKNKKPNLKKYNLNSKQKCIVKKNNYMFGFEILSDKIKSKLNSQYRFLFVTKTYPSISIGNIQNFLDYISQILPNIKFNKFTGIFELPTEYPDNIGNFTINHSMLQQTQILPLNEIKECCVCWEPTQSFTTCSHSICVECIGNLKKKNCPYCRKKNVKLIQYV
jgi:hypothetical protein